MNAKLLINWVDQPETHQKILGDYCGSYALGVTDNPPAFLLRVEPADVSSFPTVVNIHGVDVPVVVRGNFAPPVPINGACQSAMDKQRLMPAIYGRPCVSLANGDNNDYSVTVAPTIGSRCMGAVFQDCRNP